MPEISSRLIALRVLNRYKPQNTNLSEILGAALGKTGEMRGHGFARDLVWGVVRHLKSIDFIIASYARAKRIDPEVRNVLRLGLYQLVYCRNEIPEYAALSESVDLARKAGRPAAAGFVNAVLRKAQTLPKETLLYDGNPDILNTIALKFSYPLWMVRRWFERFGARETVSLCESANHQPQLTLRANTGKISRDALVSVLDNEGARVEFCRYSPDGLRFISNHPLNALSSFKNGLFCVQDEASQLVSYLLEPVPGDDILDLCCGSATKTTHLAQIAGSKVKVTGIDNSAPRIEKARANIRTFGVKNARVAKADILKLKAIKADKVLLDAPCSGLGTIRRKPDIKWNRQESDIMERYPKLQRALLQAAAGCVRPGGTLVYCTCTTEPEENERVAENFLNANPHFELVKPRLPQSGDELCSADGRFFKTYSHKNGTDCFFGAKMTRIK